MPIFCLLGLIANISFALKVISDGRKLFILLNLQVFPLIKIFSLVLSPNLSKVKIYILAVCFNLNRGVLTYDH